VILVDTSIWIDHLHRADAELTDLLGRGAVAQHPLVIGELALGTLRDRELVLDLLLNLPRLPSASHDEVLYLVESRKLFGRGLSLVDAHLLASTLLEPSAAIWTRDRRLHAAGEGLGITHRR
jgi:predicted nucleic acid-binding protein